MAETVIELDVSSPWEPPEPSGPPTSRRRLRTRWVAVCAVLAVAAGVLAAAGPRPRTGPLYQIDERVLGVTAARDMLFVNRYQESITNSNMEGRRRSDGKVLWSVPSAAQQQSRAVSAGALILVRYSNSDEPGYSSTITVLDATTGRELWSRPSAAYIGHRDHLIVVEDMTAPTNTAEFVEGEEPDPAINHAGDGPPPHLRVLDERTGATVWELPAPPGAVLDITWDGRYPTAQIISVNQLDPSGLLTRWDIRTGAVLATVRLDWSGLPAMFSTGAAWRTGPAQGPGRAMVYPDGQRGGIVFDLASGRSLFRTDVTIYDGLYQCADALFCTSANGGIVTYDSTTGKARWRIDRYTEVVATAGDRLLLSTFDQDSTKSGLLAVADARTGAIVADLTGWRLIREASGDRTLLWRPLDERTALLGQLDPVTGRVTVFGRAGDWYGPPECSADGDTLACVMVGRLTAWRLPARHARP